MKYVQCTLQNKIMHFSIQVHLKCCAHISGIFAEREAAPKFIPWQILHSTQQILCRNFRVLWQSQLQQLHPPRSKGRCPLAYYIGSLPIPDPPLHDEQVHDAVLVAPVLMMTKSDCQYWTGDYFLAINGCVEYNAQYKEDADAGSRGDTNATILCHILCIVESKDINT